MGFLQHVGNGRAVPDAEGDGVKVVRIISKLGFR